MEAGTIPRGDPSLDVIGTGGKHVVALAEHLVKRRIAIAGSWFDARYGVGKRLGAGNGRRARRGFGRLYRLHATRCRRGRAAHDRERRRQAEQRAATVCSDDSGRGTETQRRAQCARDAHGSEGETPGVARAACGAAVAATAAAPAPAAASFCRMRCSRAVASSYTAIAYSPLWL